MSHQQLVFGSIAMSLDHHQAGGKAFRLMDLPAEIYNLVIREWVPHAVSPAEQSGFEKSEVLKVNRLIRQHIQAWRQSATMLVVSTSDIFRAQDSTRQYTPQELQDAILTTTMTFSKFRKFSINIGGSNKGDGTTFSTYSIEMDIFMNAIRTLAESTHERILVYIELGDVEPLSHEGEVEAAIIRHQISRTFSEHKSNLVGRVTYWNGTLPDTIQSLCNKLGILTLDTNLEGNRLHLSQRMGGLVEENDPYRERRVGEKEEDTGL